LDANAFNKPQSGSFSYFYRGHNYDFRLAVLRTAKITSGVLRILNNHGTLTIQDLSPDYKTQKTMQDWLKLTSGLVVLSGPTGSGKTTTLYTLISSLKDKAVYSLEDPVEVIQENVIQLEINEKTGMSYSEGIKQILRHDPDLMMIGEIRDETAAKMAVRAALTGCLVMTTVHAGSIQQAIDRLLELGVSRTDLADVSQAFSNQRLLKESDSNRRYGIYDIVSGNDLKQAIFGNKLIPNKIPNLLKESAR
jgi:competence protein ComGA